MSIKSEMPEYMPSYNRKIASWMCSVTNTGESDATEVNMFVDFVAYTMTGREVKTHRVTFGLLQASAMKLSTLTFEPQELLDASTSKKIIVETRVFFKNMFGEEQPYATACNIITNGELHACK